MNSKYEGTYIIEFRYKSKAFASWSKWLSCASRGTEKAARKELKVLCGEKTCIEQEFRLIAPGGSIIQEISNVKNILRN